ncbi:hypothetical protein [Aliarcobacter cryaerophilus]|uniref:hypothetical protein n=1 Tax=Aliarcobacter cryaerophilus TaxID=28198 RepID=UPI0016544C10|nr:hypothetical protein [Aliarcobacter cryaerophilus]QNM87383.1 hypothetical protein HOO41_06440 [Aliarcobacter cryaerophilus]
MSFLESNKKVFLILFSIYFLVNIPMLLNFNGIYWDDWVLVNQNLDILNFMFTEAVGYAGYMASYLHYFMINELGIYSYRILTFLLLFLSAWFVFRILSSMTIFSSKDRFFISLIFLIAPLYNAKIALIDFPYTLFSTIFFFAFYLISKYLDNLGIVKRILILSLFFISFLLNSLLVFYAIVLIYIFYKVYDAKLIFIKNLILFSIKKLDFILIPIVFFIIKNIFFTSKGVYTGYNKIDFNNILNFDKYIEVFKLNILYPITESLQFLNIVIVFIIFIISIYFSRNLKFNLKIKKEFILLIIGFFILVLGAFPYIAVGKIPSSMEQDSRFQVLLLLGFSMIVYFLIKIISYIFITKNNYIYGFLLFLSIYIFSINSFKYQIKYHWEWIYQQSIIENFLSSDIIKNNSTFLVIDNVLHKKFIRLGEMHMNGISKAIFGKDDKLFIYRDLSQIDVFKKVCVIAKEFNCYNWVEDKPISFSIFNNQSIDVYGLLYLIKLKYLEISDNKKFKETIKDLIWLKFYD